MKILVASRNTIKTGAFEIGLQEVFSSHNIAVRGINAASEINEQPVGLEETYRGAENRIKNAKRLSAYKGYDFVGAIENGIYQRSVDGKRRWFDFAWIILENPQGHLSATMSRTIEFPTADVMEAMKRGFTTTVGSIIAERLPCDPQDPHAALTDGLHPRQQILSEAIEICAFKLKTLY